MANDILQIDEENYYKQLFKDFSKTKADVDEYVEIIRKWADTQPHLPEKPSYSVLRFVVLYNKFSIEKAKQKLDMFYTIRNLIPEYFSTTPFSPDKTFEYKVWHIVPLPKVTDDYMRIIYCKLNPKYVDPKYFVQDNLQCQICRILEYLVEEDLCYRFHFILDCANLKIGHGAKVNPMTVKKGSLIWEKVFSNRMASFYMVNFPSFLETILNTMMKPMLNPKIRKRLKVYVGTDILLEVFGKDRMPKDIGGDEKSIEELNDILMQKYQQHNDRFIQLQNLRVDESLRPAKLQNDELLGYYGNFKEINID